jgi:hypothetical protein
MIATKRGSACQGRVQFVGKRMGIRRMGFVRFVMKRG